MQPLTFGVELEFCVASLPVGSQDPERHDFRQVYGITDNRKVERSLRGISSRLYELKAVRDQIRKRLANEIVQRHLAATMTCSGFPAVTDADL